MDKTELMNLAKEASERAYAPYSNFRVGAALLCDDGQVIQGCNVENRSFGLTNCAERSAIFYAVSQGLENFKALAIYGADTEKILPPCGACRQVITEFCGGDFPVYMSKGEEVITMSLAELMPFDSLQDLKGQEV